MSLINKIYKSFVLNRTYIFLFLLVYFGLLSISVLIIEGYITFTIGNFVLAATVLFTIQSTFTLSWMLYAWENPMEIEKRKSPNIIKPASVSFSALVPARFEEKVIADTIMAIDRINYPEKLKEIIVLCRTDDLKTIKKARETIKKLGKKNIKLKIFDSLPINKPQALNEGLKSAKKDFVVIFDAEDEPNEEIYNIANTIILEKKADVLQSGVQLMNFKSSWFSALNCMEYFFWFKSGLHFFSTVGQVTPLGGNTVFFKKEYLEKVGGWDNNCLTEDADIGIRLVEAGAKVEIVYDEEHTTREETPVTVKDFIKQRTRWSQGFIQVLAKSDWLKLPKPVQKLTAFYVLISPVLQGVFILYFPVALFVVLFAKLPVWISLFSFLPLFLLFAQIAANVVGLYEFCKAYKLKIRIYDIFHIVFSYFPYQLMLSYSAYRALYRHIFQVNTWEKTLHLNAHRKTVEPRYA